MSQEIFEGRFTAKTNQQFVVFLVGMRINKLRSIFKCLPLFRRFVAMVYQLKANKSHGLLGAKRWFAWREIMYIQYWDSLESLEKFAQSKEGAHIQAWREYNLMFAKSAELGIWHEKYLLDAEQVDCVYSNMPRIGLAAAMQQVAVVPQSDTEVQTKLNQEKNAK